MERIIIERIDDYGFNVIQGDRYSEQVTYGETLELVSLLLLQEIKPRSLMWMRTKEQWDAERASWRAAGKKAQEESSNKPKTNEP